MASDFLLEIDGIKGEAQDKKYKEAIELTSFSWGVSNQGTFAQTGGGGAGKASFADMSFTSHASKASPKIAQACASGEHISKAVLHVRKQGGEAREFYTVTLEDVLVANYSISAGDASLMNDHFSLNFAKIKYEHRQQDSKGAVGAPVEMKWNQKANAKD